MTPEAETSAYETARADPDFLDRVTAEYHGVGDALDALWWREHPGEPGPSGADSRARRIGDLRRIVFSRGSSGEIAEATDELRRLERRAAADASSLEAAIASAMADRSRVAETRDGAADAEDASGDDVQESIVGEGRTGSASPSRPRRKRDPVIIGAALAAALAVGVGVGVRIPSPEAPAAEPSPPAATAFVDTSTGEIVGYATADPVPALDVFSREQNAGDRPAEKVPLEYTDDSFRFLTGVSGFSLFAARDTLARACLIASAGDGTYRSTCVSDGDFPETGLRLAWSARVDPQSIGGVSDADGERSAIEELPIMGFSVVWETSGEISAESAEIDEIAR